MKYNAGTRVLTLWHYTILFGDAPFEINIADGSPWILPEGYRFPETIAYFDVDGTAVHKTTIFRMAEMWSDGTNQSGFSATHSVDVDTPESLGQWALELGDYHHHLGDACSCQVITHLDEIDDTRPRGRIYASK